MSRSPRSGGLDWFRLPAALLVVANHTSPLLAFSPEADHVLTQILARVAVPFFLTVSGYFLLPKAEREGRRAVCPSSAGRCFSICAPHFSICLSSSIRDIVPASLARCAVSPA